MVRESFKQAKGAGVNGPFLNRIYRALHCSHPKDWARCDFCGEGYSTGLTCVKCGGFGYVLTIETGRREARARRSAITRA